MRLAPAAVALSVFAFLGLGAFLASAAPEPPTASAGATATATDPRATPTDSTTATDTTVATATGTATDTTTDASTATDATATATEADEDAAAGEPSPDSLPLPPASPEDEDEVSPAVTERPTPPEATPPPQDRTWIVIRTLLGLVALLGLAYAGGHPRVQALERRLGVSQVVTAGFPFVALGVVARLPAIGILSDSVLSSLGPLLRIALGWIGFLIGFRFDARRALQAPARTFAFMAWRGSITFGVVALTCGAVLFASRASNLRPSFLDAVLLRDSLILGVAGALTSLVTVRLLADRGGSDGAVSTVAHVLRLEELVGIVGLLVIAAYFRPQGRDATWQLPGTAWMLLTLGAGLAMGLLAIAVLTRATKGSTEALVLLIGAIAFAGGLASNLRLSPVVVCFLAGLLLGNAPGIDKRAIGDTLTKIERPIYLLFLLVVGAAWDASDVVGWALMLAFVVARFAGKWIGTAAGAAAQEYGLEPLARRSLIVAPMGALSIAVVINAQLLYPGGAISEIVTAIVGGAMITEVIVQVALSRRSDSDPSSVARAPATPEGDG